MMLQDHEQKLCDSPEHEHTAQIPLCCKVKAHCFSCHFTAIAIDHHLSIGVLAISTDAIITPLNINTHYLVFPNFRPPIFA